MDKGLSLTYKTTAFPRYHFYQPRLHSLIQRWQNILDAASFPDCKSQGRLLLKQISAEAELIGDTVTINVFADQSVLKKRKFDLPVKSPEIGNVVERNLKWSTFVYDETKSESITVVITKSIEKIKNDLVKLRELRLTDLIMVDEVTMQCGKFLNLPSHVTMATDLDEDAADSIDDTGVKFVSTTERSTSSESEIHNTALCRLIDEMLEEKIIKVMEKITDYNQDLLPRPGEDLDNSLPDEIQMKLMRSLQDFYVISDLSPEDEAFARTPTDKDLAIVSQNIGLGWEHLALELGVSGSEIDNYKMQYSSVPTQIYQMLLGWREREEGVTLKFLKQVLEKTKAAVQMESIKGIFGSGMSDVKKNEVFQKKLTDFIVKKTKCVACDHLAKKYGLNAALVNELLNAGFFDYEKQVIELLKTSSLPKWTGNLSGNPVSACKSYSFRCGMTLTKLIIDMEDYIKLKLKVLQVLNKLQFELFGYLSLANVPLQVKIPQLPKLSLDLRNELLSLDEVTGCGICYGELILHVNKKLFPVKKREIKEILHKYKYVGGYRSEVMNEENKEQALGLLLEHGQEMRARRNGEVEHNYGSVGCFVRITPKELPANQDPKVKMVSTAYVITEAKDHFLTCAHCLKGCIEEVEVRRGTTNEYSRIGTRKLNIYEPEAIDLASVQLSDDKLMNCDSKMKRSDRVAVVNWSVMDADPIRRDVHKEGPSTRFTKGLVMSTDYTTMKIREYNGQKFLRSLELNEELYPFKPSFNILIETLPGAGEYDENAVRLGHANPFQAGPFSRDGDSGSAVLADNPNVTTSVFGVALLHGAVVRNLEFIHTYASLMRQTLAEAEEQYHCIITPTRLPPGDLAQAGAVGGHVPPGGRDVGAGASLQGQRR